MRRVALALVVVLAACGGTGQDTRPDPTPTTDPTAYLRAEISRLEAELHKSNVDQQDLRDQVRKLYVDRASRSTRTRRTVARPAGDCWGWAHLVFAYDWPHATACAVLGCESGGNPNAKNARSSATGLFQILNGPYDPAANVALAYRMWRARGWQPWNVGGCP